MFATHQAIPQRHPHPNKHESPDYRGLFFNRTGYVRVVALFMNMGDFKFMNMQAGMLFIQAEHRFHNECTGIEPLRILDSGQKQDFRFHLPLIPFQNHDTVGIMTELLIGNPVIIGKQEIPIGGKSLIGFKVMPVMPNHLPVV